jgi:hypothetical protein
VTYAIAALAQPLTGRQVWRLGGVYISDIFQLLLPGIDLNDPGKTGLSCMAISNMVDFIRLGDISEVEDGKDVTPGARALRQAPRPTVADDPHDPAQHELEDLSPEEIDERIRFCTSIFRDWVPDFLGRVLLLFSNLPEEGGKSGRAGGKTEQMTLQSVLVSGAFCRHWTILMDSTPVAESLLLWTRDCTTMCSSRCTSTSRLHAERMLWMPWGSLFETLRLPMRQRSLRSFSPSVDIGSYPS